MPKYRYIGASKVRVPGFGVILPGEVITGFVHHPLFIRQSKKTKRKVTTMK